MNKRPAFLFYPSDWLSDPALRACSAAARGIWIDLLCIMHKCSPCGTLLINEQPPELHQIARLLNEAPGTLKPLLKELEASGVFRQDDSGAIYSPRMRRDEDIRIKRASAGVLGGNPQLCKNRSYSNIDEDVVGAALAELSELPISIERDTIIKNLLNHFPSDKREVIPADISTPKIWLLNYRIVSGQKSPATVGNVTAYLRGLKETDKEIFQIMLTVSKREQKKSEALRAKERERQEDEEERNQNAAEMKAKIKKFNDHLQSGTFHDSDGDNEIQGNNDNGTNNTCPKTA